MAPGHRLRERLRPQVERRVDVGGAADEEAQQPIAVTRVERLDVEHRPYSGTGAADVTSRYGAPAGGSPPKSASWSTSAVWSARRPVPSAICVRQEKPSATISVSSGAARTAGGRTRPPARLETREGSPGSHPNEPAIPPQ